MSKIHCVLPQLSQPRCVKRVQNLISSGFEVEVYGLDNGLYTDNIKDFSCTVHRYPITRSSSKTASLSMRFKMMRDVIRSMGKNDKVYLFGIEMALYYKFLIGRKRYFYEQADLNYTKLKKNWAVSIFKVIDKWLIEKSALTVLTSQGFIDYLYGESAVPANVCLMPNKLHPSFMEFERPKARLFEQKTIRFSFIGAVRYPRTLFTFAEVIGKDFPQHEFHFYGEGFSSDKAKELCEAYPNLFYHGRFSNPKDLPHIYEKTDVNVVCYDPNSANVRIAEPNKLYESAYFCVPIIVSAGTFLEKRVKEMGIGTAINAYDPESVKSFVGSMSVDKLCEYSQNAAALSADTLIDSTDEFIERIGNLNS